MNRSILAVATLALLGSPLASHADVAEQAMDACVQAFIAANLPKEQPVVIDKRNVVSLQPDAHRNYRVVLTATGRTSGRQIAKGTCVANREGEVVMLNGSDCRSSFRRPSRTTRPLHADSTVIPGARPTSP